MARASRNRRTRGRASVVGSRELASRPRANHPIGFAVPTQARPWEAVSKKRLMSQIQTPGRRWVYVGRHKLELVSPRQLRRDAERAADRQRKRALYDSSYRQVFAKLRYLNPRRVISCVKRSIRREVLHAFGKVGYSGSGPGRWNGLRRSYRRTADSGYGC